LIGPGEGNCREAEEARSRVAVAPWRRPDEGVVARTEPGDHQCKWFPLYLASALSRTAPAETIDDQRSPG